MQLGLGHGLTRRGRYAAGINPAVLTLIFDTNLATTVGVPITPTASGTVNIDWGDGAGPQAHTTAGWKTRDLSALPLGEKTIQITGDLSRLWTSVLPTTEYNALVRVESWGTLGATHFWLYGAANLVSVPSTIPSSVTMLDEMFKNCTSFNSPNVTNWNVANVTNARECFRGCTVFNQPLNWSAPLVTTWERFIGSCPAFNQTITFIGNPSSVASIDIADFANDASIWEGTGANQWGWAKFSGCANWALQANKLSVDLSGVTPTNCTNAANAWAFAGTTATTKPKIPLNWPALTNAAGMLKASGITQNIGGFRAASATNMNAMLQTMPNNTSNLSLWPVPLIATRPSLFADGSGFTAEPVWGTSPAADTTAPTITSASTASVAENSVLAYTATANETIYQWRIVGGADSAKFEFSGSTLRWLSNGTKDFEAPDDVGLNNVYDVQFVAEDISGNVSAPFALAVTVTDVSDTGVVPSDITGNKLWLDPDDPTKVFTDTAGTTQAAVGDLVARVNDKSPGSALFAEQATSGNRPTLRLDATSGNRYLEFSGSQFMTVASLDLSATDAITFSVAMQKGSDAAVARTLDFNTAVTAGSFTLQTPPSAGFSRYSITSNGSLLATATITDAAYAAPVTNVVTGLAKISTDTLQLRIGNVQVASSVQDQGTGNFKSDTLHIGQRANGTSRLTGRVYGVTVYNTMLGSTDLTNDYNFLVGKIT